MASDPIRVVVSDSSVLINFLHLGRLEFFARLPGHRLVITEEVDAEIKRPEQRAELDRMLDLGLIERVPITNLETLTLAAELMAYLGRGEAASLAVARERDWWLACDEKGRFRSEAIERLGKERLLGTPELFVLAIRARMMSIDEADAAKAQLERHRFKMSFESFRQRLEQS